MTSRPNSANQLQLELARQDTAGGRVTADRLCRVCGAALAGHRRDALYCGDPCRAEASRVRRLREGRAVDGYEDLKTYNARHRRTELAPVGG
jgi:hypothetical protein